MGGAAVATQCRIGSGFRFQSKLITQFDGGTLTTDAGLVLIREFDDRLGLSGAVARAMSDARTAKRTRHSMLACVRQRLFQIVGGYEDANDATCLRHDPTLQAVAARPGRVLASQPTLSRLENAADWSSIERLKRLPVEWFCQHGWRARRPPQELIVDIDATDDPTHGQQALSFFHGYYDQYIYHPLVIFEGTTGHVLGAQLRPGNEGGATRLLPLVGPIVRRLQRRFPKTAIALRADADFATPEVLEFAETDHCPYAIGLRRNPVLEAAIAITVAGAECRFELGGEPIRDFTSFEYHAERWPHPRRVVAKIEITSLGRNVRFLVTNRPEEPADVFAWYNRRGEAENCIKDLKNGLHADRLSCHVYRANAFRLQLHVLAYALLALFRQHLLAGTALATATFDTIRLRLLKVAARVRHSVRRLWFHLASGWPGQPLFELVQARVHAVKPSG
jgi:hypothetical protein